MECFDDMACWIWQTMGNQLAGGQWSGLNISMDTIVRAFDVFKHMAI